MSKKLISALAVALCAVAGASHAATGLSFANLTGAEYDTAGVFVTGDILFTGSVDDGAGFDQVTFDLWDDGNVKFNQTYQLAVGTSGSFHFDVYYPGLVGTSAQGVGLYLTDSVDNVTIDPYDVPHYADPSECHVSCGPVGGVPEPTTYALALVGLGIVGAVTRRKAKAA
ncbi:MAG: PEP-CTERM sorting domain-containing protein [Pseudomonadota bacterium]